MIIATRLKSGNIIKHEGELCRVVDVDHVQPGKGRAMLQVSMVNLIKGTKVAFRFRPQDKIEDVRVEEKEMDYLYHDGSNYVFMNQETYEQFELSEAIVGEKKLLIKPNITCSIAFFEGSPISMTPPMTVTLEITDTAPPLKGATAAGSLKPATLESGLVVQVPPFIKKGGSIKVDTRTKAYIERAK